jgi:hypothetical protein
VADVLQSAMAWLNGVREASVSQTVVYRRGTQSVTVPATFGHSLLRVYDGQGGTKTERTEKDFILTASRLDFGAGPVDPQRGDFVDWKNPAGQTVRYEVMGPAREPEFREDPWALTVRVHAKFKAIL